MRISKKEKADLHRLVKKADSVVGGCVVFLMMLLMPLMFVDWLLYSPWYTTAALCGIMAQALCFMFFEKKFCAAVEWVCSCLIVTALLPVIILLFGVSTVPRYYKYWFHSMLALQKAR